MQCVLSAIGLAREIIAMLRERTLSTMYEFQVGLGALGSSKRQSPNVVYVYVDQAARRRR
ncbi:MAG: hypothetical protein JO352_33040 [Chloroflexi bacterium]|nr:hypothetical protein [Chloroflexota bacterium]